MPDAAWVASLLAAVTFRSAWRDYAGGNRRDAGFLGVIGSAFALGAVIAWVG